MDKPETPTVEKTVAAIEKSLEDLKKGTATKTEVLALIDERVKTDAEAAKASEERIDTLVSEVDETKAASDVLRKQLKALQSNSFSAMKDYSGNYKGMFNNHREAKAFGLYVMAAATANKEGVKHMHEMATKALGGMGIDPIYLGENGLKTMTGSSQSGGSALVTTEFIPSLIAMFENYGVYEGEALAVPMGSSGSLQPKTDTLLDLYCPGEGGTITTQDPDIKLVSHTLKTLCALTAYSTELDEDSAIALGELLAGILVRSYAYGIDKIGFLGDGTSTYFGFTGIAGALRAVDATIGSIKSLVVGAGNAYSELTLANFQSVAGNVPEYADDGFLKWYAHRYFYYTVMVKLALAAGGANATEIILGAGQKQKQFLAYPVRFTQVMPKAEANSQICTLLANLKLGSQLGRRGVLEIAQSTERYFEKNLVAVRARRRISINNHGVGDTTNAGPICGLITAAS